VCAHLGHEPAHAEDDVDETAPEFVIPTRGRLHAGAEAIRRLVRVDQKPIGRTPRSNLATYTGLFDAVRKLYAATPAARKRHYDAGRFSFNVAKGRCETCDGEGFVSVELLFAYFSDRGRPFQADRGRQISAVGDAPGRRASSRFECISSSTISLKRAVIGPGSGLGLME